MYTVLLAGFADEMEKIAVSADWIGRKTHSFAAGATADNAAERATRVRNFQDNKLSKYTSLTNDHVSGKVNEARQSNAHFGKAYKAAPGGSEAAKETGLLKYKRKLDRVRNQTPSTPAPVAAHVPAPSVAAVPHAPVPHAPVPAARVASPMMAKARNFATQHWKKGVGGAAVLGAGAYGLHKLRQRQAQNG